MDQQLNHLTTVIEGQMRAPTGLTVPTRLFIPGGHFHWLHWQALRTFHKPGKAIEAT